MTDSDLSFQHYKVLRRTDGSSWELGRGSMGITYKAFDVNLCCEVALKVINAATLEHPHARERFVSEARVAAKLRHRNIASVYHLGNDGEHYFYAMEFVAGETLDALVRRQGPVGVPAALRILLQAARALAAASRQGLVHRDLKPANIMVTHEDDDDDMLVKVIDFGLAKPVNSPDGSRPLTFGGFVGTPQFSSPEQLEERKVDVRSDIYSLGATAWFLLTGRAPFLGSLAAICRQHLTDAPPWSQLPKPFPETVRTLLAHMLEKDPARRPADAVELRRLIEASLEVIRDPQSDSAAVRRRMQTKPAWYRSPASRTNGTHPPSEAEAPRTGMILKGRYELLRLVGEGNSGQVFLARDRAENETLVALKVLHPELVHAPDDLERLGEEVRLIQASEHPQLIRISSLENLTSQNTAFLVEEWLHGFTLLDFLAVRGGSLPVAEGLRLVEQAASAADHAESRRLERLDFSLHQFHVHFPARRGSLDDPDGARQPMQTPLAQWPAWLLKLNPLGALRSGLESSTWAGDVTLVPGGAPPVARPAASSGRASPQLRDQYTRGVAQLAYELLGGSPVLPLYDAGRTTKFASLAALNEEANAILQNGLREHPPFSSGTEFYQALARAAGCNPANLAASIAPRLASKQSVPSKAATPAAKGSAAGSALAAPLALGMAAMLKGEKPPTRTAPASFGSPGASPTRAVEANAIEPWSSDLPEESPGTVWDRMALVSGEGSSSKLWMGGIAACFLALLIGCLAFVKLVGRHPSGSSSRYAKVVTSRLPRSGPMPQSSRVPLAPVHRPLAAATVQAAPSTPAGPAPSLSPSPSAADIPGVTPNVASVSGHTHFQPGLPNVSATLPVPSDTPPPLGSTPHPALARLHVESKPAGVDVLSKGKLLGTTPFDVSLPAGDYQLISRYKNWPEVRQSIHLDDTQAASTELHMLPPGLVPAAGLAATSSPAALAKARRAQDDATIRRNFVRSTRGADASTPGPDSSSAEDTHRTTPSLHPFDPEGVFRQPTPPRDDD